MFDRILKVADRYDEGLIKVQRRREQWMSKYEMVKEHLKVVAQHLNEHTRYKQGFFVDTMHAFNEEIKGTSSRMPSVMFRSGAMPMLVTFRNSMGEKKTYSEEGFSIAFTPTITGQIVVMLQPHFSDLDAEQPEMVNLAIINDPAQLSEAIIDEVIARGMELAYYSSFTGMTDVPADESAPAENSLNKRNVIGFKRYETTEKME